MEKRLIGETGLERNKAHSKGDNFNQTINNIMNDLSKTFDNLNLDNFNSETETESEKYQSQRGRILEGKNENLQSEKEQERMVHNFKKSNRPDVQREYRTEMSQREGTLSGSRYIFNNFVNIRLKSSSDI